MPSVDSKISIWDVVSNIIIAIRVVIKKWTIYKIPSGISENIICNGKKSTQRNNNTKPPITGTNNKLLKCENGVLAQIKKNTVNIK